MAEERDFSYLERNFAAVRASLAEAEKRAGVPAGSVRLVGVTKYADVDAINYAVDRLGLREIGENRVQSLLEKYDRLHRENLSIHLIGTLQRNKVKYIIDKVDLIESLDSIPLAAEIDRQAERAGRVMDVLVEINSGREANKGGILPEELSGFLDALVPYAHLRVRGLMTIGPVCADETERKKYFEETYRSFVDIFAKKLHNVSYENTILSMGMSHGFETAVSCGSGMVRIGTALFGKPDVVPV